MVRVVCADICPQVILDTDNVLDRIYHTAADIDREVLAIVVAPRMVVLENARLGCLALFRTNRRVRSQIEEGAAPGRRRSCACGYRSRRRGRIIGDAGTSRSGSQEQQGGR